MFTMPREKKSRKIFSKPNFKGFKPIVYNQNNETILLLLEEYESIILCDYRLLSQQEASELMGVSRPTFTRIYEQARRKIALSFFEGSPIVFEGGKVHFDSEWRECLDCKSKFTINPNDVNTCKLCGSNKIKNI